MKKINLKTERSQRIMWSYIMLSPLIFGFLVFTIYPLLWAVRLSFFSYDGIPSHTFFTGITNYVNAFTADKTFWKVMLNSFIIMGMKLPVEMVLALVMAILLNKNIKGRSFFRGAYYMPTIISSAIVGLVFTNLFGYFGMINKYLMNIHLIKEPIDWFAKKNTSMITIVVASMWGTLGVNMLYFLSALQNIPKELYESADLDGANTIQVFLNITLPAIAPVAQIIVMLGIVGSLHMSDLIIVLTGGAPSGQTHTVMSYIVSRFVPAFSTESVNIGYGCALSIITAAVFAVFTMIYMKISKKSNSLTD